MKRTIITLTLFFIIITTLSPRSEARNLFRDLFRGIKNVSRFVVTLPDKSTRWMGPVLGPIAANIISQNLAVNKHVGELFVHANRINQNINNIEEQKKYLSQVQKNLLNQADDLHKQAQEIRDLKTNLEKNLLSGDLSYDEYKDKFIALENVAGAYERTADRFTQTARNIKSENLIGMIARNTWNQTIRQIKNEVNYTIRSEIDKYVNPQVISFLVGKDDKSLDQVIEILATGNISSILGQKGSKIDSDELKNRVAERIKSVLEQNKDAFKNDWRGQINRIINEEISKLEKEKENLPKPEASEEKSEDKASSGSSEQKSDGCPNGYVFCARCGISCIQANCNEVDDGHYSYDGHCICGSAGSINENPDDPNKACYYSREYESCPGCLYACVHSKEDCPLDGIGEY